jgi:hypothetical protein
MNIEETQVLMSNTVFILGAGTSKEAGGPLMADFLDAADKLWKKRCVGSDAVSFELVFRGIATLKALYFCRFPVTYCGTI